MMVTPDYMPRAAIEALRDLTMHEPWGDCEQTFVHGGAMHDPFPDDAVPQYGYGIREAMRRAERAQRARLLWLLGVALVAGVGIGVGTAWLVKLIGGM